MDNDMHIELNTEPLSLNRSSELRNYLNSANAKEISEILRASFDEIENRYSNPSSEEEKDECFLSLVSLRSRIFWIFNEKFNGSGKIHTR